MLSYLWVFRGEGVHVGVPRVRLVEHVHEALVYGAVQEFVEAEEEEVPVAKFGLLFVLFK